MPTDAGPTSHPAALTLQPEPQRWLESLRAPFNLTAEQRAFRSQLNLPTDRPVIMSGHQAQLWHPGILAKLLALDAAARAPGTNAATAWLIPDQDTPELPLIRFPARDAAGDLTVGAWPREPTPPHADIPAASRPALNPASEFTAAPATPEVAEGLTRIRAALARHAGEPTLSQQFARAALEMAAPLARPPAPPPTLLFASRLASTDLFRALVDLARADPDRAARTYNQSIAIAPQARLRPLDASSPRGVELPFWRLAPGRPRTPVHAADLAEAPITELAPRALLLTGLMRLAACEVFIHGTGGAEYDRASEAWLRAWLTPKPWTDLLSRLARSTTATATLLLPLGVEPITEEELARARWRAHHARHNPADLGDKAAQQAKLAHVAMLRDLPRNSHARAEAFRTLHSSLVAARRGHQQQLADLDRAAADIAARARAGRIAADRTWPFPLYPEQALLNLQSDIHAAFAASTPS